MGLIIKLPFVLMTIGRAMSKADYFHLRSPSNISALAAIVQILFPSKPKSVKYAGNWSPNMPLPRGYRLQKWVYTNPLITKNTKVLVYGQWPNQPKSVIPFIQATFKNEDRVSPIQRDYSERLIFTFVGAMVPGKRPIFAVRIIQSLLKSGVQAELHMYGDGILLDEVKSLLEREELKAHVMVYGNRHITEIRNAFKTSHFAILPSLSEGWPKAIAEGMFFGAIPIAHQVSCVPWMLGNGKRGVLIDKDLNKAVDAIEHCLAKDDIELNKMSSRAMKWSQQFTMEKLNDEISKVINT
jgi:glycosyltransferase involved in cell wall biosynthesis